MDTSRESIVNNEGIKEHSGSCFCWLVCRRNSHGKLSEMVRHDQHIGDTPSSIFKGKKVQSHQLHGLAGYDTLQGSTLW